MLIKREWKGKIGMKQAERVKECKMKVKLNLYSTLQHSFKAVLQKIMKLFIIVVIFSGLIRCG